MPTENDMPENRKPESEFDSDEETYELADEPELPTPAPAQGSIRSNAPLDDEDTYDLADEEPAPPPPPAYKPPKITPSASSSAFADDALSLDDTLPSDPSVPRRPKLYDDEQPKYVDPETARLRREEQRKAAAEQAAVDAARSLKIKLIVAGVIVVIGLAIGAYYAL